MSLTVPAKAYRGVVLVTRRANQGARVRLDHRDPDLNVPLFDEPADAVAAWIKWADFLRLPRLVETPDGALVPFDRSLGSLVLGDAGSDRRWSKTVGARRPRFLGRRKIGARIERRSST